MAPNPAEVSVRVTAGPAYDPATHQTVLVNAATPTHISSETCTLDLSVRIRNFKGKPHISDHLHWVVLTYYYHQVCHMALQIIPLTSPIPVTNGTNTQYPSPLFHTSQYRVRILSSVMTLITQYATGCHTAQARHSIYSKA